MRNYMAISFKIAEVERQEQMASYEAAARAVISKIVREEVVPALNEKLGRFLEELPGQGMKERAAELGKRRYWP